MINSNKYYNYIIIANEFLYKEEYSKAKNAFIKALSNSKSDKEKIDAMYEIADINLLLKNYQDAFNNFKEILDLKNDEAGACYGLAISNDFLKGDYNFSIEYYKKAIEIDKNYDRAYFYLGLIYDKLDRKDEAIECLKKCIEIDSYDYNSYNIIGAIYESKKEYEKALKYVRKSLNIKPGFGEGLFNMGVIYKALGNNDEALNYYKKAVGEFQSPYLFLNMSALYIEREDYKKAVSILLVGLSDFPNSVNLHYNLACSYKNLGKKDLALEELKTAIKLNRDAYDWAKEDLDLKNLVEVIKW
ncbi:MULTISPECIES: lipopolysaccharide assembly protein LapB [Peptoniphilus]|uniref:tetratricopeptide repeat protein n=1 Tax=Peptoniphilus TaxID=162289 RepID=UPI0001DCA1B6|nr:tetratricopeptide repeat protein [Peptoniphilus sp. oral taxon 836]EFK38252.1 tetratricopeptide repeat protein [Peptoniphilus sp. oral taxon 836 str. F0141]